MGTTRNCKKCGKPYSLIAPYSKCRHDIRDYCPQCIREMQQQTGMEAGEVEIE